MNYFAYDLFPHEMKHGISGANLRDTANTLILERRNISA